MKTSKELESSKTARPAGRATREEGGAVGSFSRGLAILDILTQATGFITLSELATESGLDASTTHRLVQTLVEQGYAVRDEQTKRYLPGPRALAPLSLFHPLTLLKREARSILELVCEHTGISTALVLFIGKERMVVDFAQGKQQLSAYYDSWLKSPLHGSASGKLLLGWLSSAEREALLGPGPYRACTSKTITDREVLSKCLAEVRSQGYAVARDDAYEGLTAIAAPLVAHAEGRPIGCLAVSGASYALPPDRDAEIASRLQSGAQLLMGSSPSVQIIKTWTSRAAADLSDSE